MSEYVRVSVPVVHVHFNMKGPFFERKLFFPDVVLICPPKNALDRPSLGRGRKRRRGIVLLVADPGAACQSMTLRGTGNQESPGKEGGH